MLELLECKFNQIPAFNNAIRRGLGRVKYVHPLPDPFWGTGLDGNGSDFFGVCLNTLASKVSQRSDLSQQVPLEKSPVTPMPGPSEVTPGSPKHCHVPRPPAFNINSPEIPSKSTSCPDLTTPRNLSYSQALKLPAKLTSAPSTPATSTSEKRILNRATPFRNPNLTPLPLRESAGPSIASPEASPTSGPPSPTPESPSGITPPAKRTKLSSSPVPTIHATRARGMLDTWAFPEVKKDIIFFGDSNLSRVTCSPNPNVQIDSYPGAQIRHIKKLVDEYKGTQSPKHMIVSIGINNRANNPKSTLITELRKMVSSLKNKFPHSKIYIPEINIPSRILKLHQDNLKALNHALRNLNKDINIIPPLADSKFHISPTDNTGIHWTNATANEFIKHCIMHLN